MTTSPLIRLRWLWTILLPGLLPAQGSLSLAEAVERAVRVHPSLAAERSRSGVARELAEEARAGWRPQVNYRESFESSNNPVFVFGTLLTQRQFSAANFELNRLNRPDFVNNFQSLITAEQRLWDAGRTKNAVAAARSGVAAAAAREQTAEQGLIARVARVYLEAVVLTEAVAAAQKAVESGEADLVRARTIRDAGRATDADVLSASVAVAQLREQLDVRLSQRRVALAGLNEAIGAPLETDYVLAAPSGPGTVGAGQRPELEGLRHQREALESELAGAKAALWPQVSLRGAFEADRQRFVTRSGVNQFAGVSLEWRLWQGGAERARIRAAAHRVEAAKQDERAMASRVSLEIKQAQESVAVAEASVAATGAAVAMAEESLRITRNRYEAGFATVTELLRAQSAAVDAELRALMARHAVRVAKVGVAAATGELNVNSEVLR